MPSPDQYYSFYMKYIRGLTKVGEQAIGWCCLHPDEGHGQKGFSINLRTGQWMCHSGCGSGNTTGFITEWNKLLGKAKGIIPHNLNPDHKSVILPEQPVSGGAFNHYFNSLCVNSMAKVLVYLEGRGVQRSLVDWLIQKKMIAYEQDSHGAEWVVFPVKNKHGDITGLNRRHIGGTLFKAKNKSEGNMVGGFWGLPVGDQVMVCEGVITAITLLDAGIPAISVISSGNPVDPEIFKDVREVIFGFDRGEEGKVIKAAQFLGYCRAVQWGSSYAHNFDFNDLLCQMLREGKSRQDFKNQIIKMMARSLPIQTVYTAGERFDQFEKTMDVMAQRDLLGTTSGFPVLDRKCLGLIGVTVVGGPAKSGKSTLAMNIALNHLKLGKPIYYVDYEMGFNWTLLRMLSVLTGLHEHRCIKIFRKATKHTQYLREIAGNLLIEENVRSLNFQLFESQIRALERKSGQKIELVVVDSLQKLPFIKVGMKLITDQRQVTEEWMNFFEAVKDRLGVTILVISELTRGAGEFKETGRIEYAGDQLFKLFVHQDSAMQYSDLFLDYSRHTKRAAISRFVLELDKVSADECPEDPEFSFALREEELSAGWKKPKKQRTGGDE